MISVILQHYVLFSVGGLLAFMVGTIIRRIYFHPLSGYPGPFLAKFTDFYTYSSVLRKKRTIEEYELLKQYGSPCRVGTNLLVFSDPDSIAEIYGQSSQTCIKDPSLYEAFSVTGTRNVFNAVDKSEHSRLRRLLANGFAARSLLEREDLFTQKIDEYIDLVFKGKEGEVIDIYTPTHHLYLDIISFLSFGKSLNTLQGYNHQVERDLDSFVSVMPATSLAHGIQYLPIRWIQEGLKGVQRLSHFSQTHINEYLQEISADKSKQDLERSLMYRLVCSTDTETNTSLSQMELAEHAMLFLSAGSGTTATALLWLIWQVGQLPEVYKRLTEELRAEFPDPTIFPTYDRLRKLPYFNNVIEESLRLWGPLTSSSPRISPGKNIGSKFIPAGVKVQSNPYATARDPTVFPDPHNFNPSRWEKPTSLMRIMSRPFSSGPRNCIGKHLAEITFALSVARLYQLYDIKPDPGMTADVIQVQDNGPFKLWEERLLVKATPVSTIAGASP